MPDIFISHATKDDAAVTDIYHKLKAAGISSWVDHINNVGISAGQEWDRAIHNALNDCGAGLVILTPQSAKSAEVNAEYRRIMTLGKILYVALLETVAKEDFPYRLTTIQYVDLTKNRDAGLETLIDAMQKKRLLDSADEQVKLLRPITSRMAIDPNLNIPIIGRDVDLEKIKALLTEKRPVFIVGVGGLGKSRLAYELSAHIADVDGVIWYVCDEVSSPSGLLELLKEHFGLPLDTLQGEVIAHLRNHKRLIVLDNAESVSADRRKEFSNLVNQLCQHEAQVVLTSRVEWDELRPCKVHAPQTLAFAQAMEVTEAMCTAFEVSLDKDRLENLTKAAFQHPRLIEWAVALTLRRDVDRVLAMLAELKGRALQDALDGMIRKTVEQMVSSSDVGKYAETSLKRLVICRGGFTYSAAKVLAIDEANEDLPQNEDDLDEALDLLQQWRFVRRDASTGRMDIDPIVIAVIGADKNAYHLHYEFYKLLALVHDKKQDYFGLSVESANLDIAFERAFELENYEDAYWLLSTCRPFLSNRGRFNEQLMWIQSLMPYIEKSEDEGLKWAAYNSLGNIYGTYPAGNIGENLKQAIVAYEQALINYTGHKQSIYAGIYNNMGNIYANLGSIERSKVNLNWAIKSFKKALQYWTPHNAPLNYASAQNNLGGIYIELAKLENPKENLDWAIKSFEKALQYWTPHNAPLNYASAQNNLGMAYHTLAEIGEQQDNLSISANAYKESLKYRTPVSAPIEYAKTLANLGIVYKDMGHFSKSIECWREAKKYFQQASFLQDMEKMQARIDEVQSYNE